MKKLTTTNMPALIYLTKIYRSQKLPASLKLLGTGRQAGKTLRAIVALIAIFWLTQLLPFGGIEGGFCQDNVGIGTDDPDPNAILELYATDKGLLVPRLTTAQRTGMTGSLTFAQMGLLVFDAGDQQFWYWDGGQWVTIGGGGGGCVTLDEAYDCGGAGVGRIITSDAGAVEINASIASSIALKASHSNVGVAINTESTSSSNSFSTIQSISNSTQANIAAVLGHSTANAYGVSGQVDAGATASAAVHGNNLRPAGGHGVWGLGNNGVVGESASGSGFGVYGSGLTGVQGVTSSTAFSGTVGQNTATPGSGAVGVLGDAPVGVKGQTTDGQGYGVDGLNASSSAVYNNIAVYGQGTWIGVLGKTTDPTGFGILSLDNIGTMGGAKLFIIDHPLDPENKYLKHFSIESPEILNLYRGSIILDKNGEAVVELPDYFNSININFTYNLTPIGSPAPNLFIKEKIKNGQFKIGGGIPKMEVSWVIYAERNNLFLQKHPEIKNAETNKRQKGKYIHPELYNQPESKGQFYNKSINSKTELLKLNPPINTSKKEQLNILK